jgi:uncharacterized membrane protein
MKIKEYRRRLLTWFGQIGKSCLARVNEYRKIWPTDYRETNELLLVPPLLIVLLLVIVVFPSNALRIVLGLPLVLFLPGYTLLAALFVRKDRLKGLDRLALSFAASVAIVPLLGLVINYLPGGIGLPSFFVVIALFVLVVSAVAWIRRGRLVEGERFSVILRWPQSAFGGGIFKKFPSIVVALAALAVVVSLVYIIVTPKIQESFTEFYISGISDVSGYPPELKVNEEQKVLVTVVNREGRTLDYRIEGSYNGKKIGQVGPLLLEDGQRYEAKIDFRPVVPGPGQEVEFVLYIDGETEPYLEPLRLTFDVY